MEVTCFTMICAIKYHRIFQLLMFQLVSHQSKFLLQGNFLLENVPKKELFGLTLEFRIAALACGIM